MEFVKKNIASLVCGVIALLAIVLYFYPLGSVKKNAQAALDKRIQVQTTMNQLLSQPRNLPVVDLSGGTEPQKLTVFPTQPVIEWGQGFKQKIADAGKSVTDAALMLNRREPLVPNALPSPAPAVGFAFRDAYFAAMAKLPSEFGAGEPPTAAEVQQTLTDLAQSKAEANGGAAAMANRAMDEEGAREQASVLKNLAVERAKKLLVYIDPNALEVNAQIPAQGAAPTAHAMWYAQMSLWLQTDLLKAVYEMNKPAGSVINAPIKNILKIQIEGYRTATGLVGAGDAAGKSMAMGGMGPMGMPPGMMGGMPPGMMGGMPMGPMGGQGGATPAPDGPSYTLSPTGRVCNSMYDVISCKLILHIEADKLPAFIEQLGRNRFLTVYQVSLDSLDTVVFQPTANVVYGSAPVVQATISCEALMLRDWTLPLMPETVKQQLGIVTGGQTAQPQ